MVQFFITRFFALLCDSSCGCDVDFYFYYFLVEVSEVEEHAEVEEKEFEVTSGGGAVKLTMTGKKTIKAINKMKRLVVIILLPFAFYPIF